MMKRMDIIIKLAETEIDKYIIDIEFEQYSLSCASNMATTNGYWSFTDNQAFYLFLSFLRACTMHISLTDSNINFVWHLDLLQEAS